MPGSDSVYCLQLIIMAKQKPSARLGASLIVASSIFYASYGVWTVEMGDAFGGYLAAGIRSVGALFILVVIAVVLKKLEPLNLRRTWPYLAGMLVTSLFGWGPFYYSILHAGVGISLTINYMCVVIGMLFFGWLLGKERLTKTKLAAALLGVVGLALVYVPSVSGFGWVALAAAAMSGLTSSLNTVFLKLLPYGATQSIVFGWGTAAIANLFMAILLHETAPPIGLGAEWLYLIIFTVTSVAASWLFTSGMKLTDAGVAGVLGMLQIVFAITFGMVFFGEKPGTVVLLGAATIIVSAAIPYVQSWRMGRKSASRKTRRLKAAPARGI